MKFNLFVLITNDQNNLSELLVFEMVYTLSAHILLERLHNCSGELISALYFR